MIDVITIINAYEVFIFFVNNYFSDNTMFKFLLFFVS